MAELTNMICDCDLDFADASLITLRVHQNDTQRKIRFNLFNDGKVYTIPYNSNNFFVWLKLKYTSDYFIVKRYTASQVSATEDSVTIPLTQDMLQLHGLVNCDLTLSNGSAQSLDELYDSAKSEILTASSFNIYIEPLIENDVKASDLSLALKLAANETFKEDEHIRQSQETLRNEAENIRVKSEQIRFENEANRQNYESERISNENQRIQAEMQRINNEQIRVEQSENLKNMEDTRWQNEDSRTRHEEQRRSQETARVEAEDNRVKSEQTRCKNESNRENGEVDRTNAEKARIEAEKQRVTEFNSVKADAIKQANYAKEQGDRAKEIADGAIPQLIGATSSADGQSGVPTAPLKGDENKVLFGEGAWKDLDSAQVTTYSQFHALNSFKEPNTSEKTKISLSNLFQAIAYKFYYIKDLFANNLTTTSEGRALDARQGKILNDKITTLQDEHPVKTYINHDGVAGFYRPTDNQFIPFKSQSDIDSAVSDAMQGNSTAADVLEGKTFTNKDGSNKVGTMPNNGAVSATLNAGASYTIPKGYHSGAGKITANSLASQTKVDSDKTAIAAAQVLTGYQGYVNGTKVSGSMPNNDTWNYSINPSNSIKIPCGYHSGKGYVTANPNQNSDIYHFGSNDGSKKDLGVTNTYRYVDATNVYKYAHTLSSAQTANLQYGSTKLTFSGLAVGKICCFMLIVPLQSSKTDGINLVETLFTVTGMTIKRNTNWYLNPAAHGFKTKAKDVNGNLVAFNIILFFAEITDANAFLTLKDTSVLIPNGIIGCKYVNIG